MSYPLCSHAIVFTSNWLWAYLYFYIHIYVYVYREEIFMEISEFFNSVSRDPRNLLAGIWKEEEVEGGSQGGKEE